MISMLTVTFWRLSIGAPALGLLALGVYYTPDRVRAAYEGAQDVAQSAAASFEGHFGLLAAVLADGWPVLIAAIIFAVGVVIASLTQKKAAWGALLVMTIVPFLAKALSLGLAHMQWDDWLIKAGRSINDALPYAVRSWGNLAGLEQQLQLVVLMTLVTVALSIFSFTRR